MNAMQSHGSLKNASFIQVKSGQTGAKMLGKIYNGQVIRKKKTTERCS